MTEKDIELHQPCCDNLNKSHKGYCVFCSQTKLTEYPCPTIQAALSTPIVSSDAD
jgi:hypothetical protein